MKRKLIGIATALMLVSGVVSAESMNGSWNGNPIVKVVAGGSPLSDEVPAQIIEDKTMVPLTMLRKLGVDVMWRGDDYSVEVKLPDQNHELSSERLAKISRSVGNVYVYDSSGHAINQGSGFEIDGDWFVTSELVIRGADRLEIAMDGRRYTVAAHDIFANSKTGTALMRLAGPATLSYVDYLPMQGELSYVLGYPMEQYRHSKGVVTASSDAVGISHTSDTDIGSRGGPLINGHGEVIGVVAGGAVSIPMARVNEEIARLR